MTTAKTCNPQSAIRSLQFIKVEAAGNDLVLVDARGEPPRHWHSLAIRLCDRRRGVGGDGDQTKEKGAHGGPSWVIRIAE